MHCQKCGGFLELEYDARSCGGFGDIHKCRRCGAQFRQTTGGIIATPGGETLEPLQSDPTSPTKLAKPEDPSFLNLLRRLANGRRP